MKLGIKSVVDQVSLSANDRDQHEHRLTYIKRHTDERVFLEKVFFAKPILCEASAGLTLIFRCPGFEPRSRQQDFLLGTEINWHC